MTARTTSFIDFEKHDKRVYFPASWADLEKYPKKVFFQVLEIAAKKQGIDKNFLLAKIFLGNHLRHLEPNYLHITVQSFEFVESYELYKLPNHNNLSTRGERLQNCTLDEFANADIYYYYLCYTEQKTEMLNKLVAVLLRPKGKQFQSTEIEAHEADIKKVPIWYKLAVLKYFVSSKIALQKIFPDVLGDPEEQQQAEEKKPKVTPPPPDWNKLVISLVGNDISKIKEIEQTNIYSVLLYLREANKKS